MFKALSVLLLRVYILLAVFLSYCCPPIHKRWTTRKKEKFKVDINFLRMLYIKALRMQQSRFMSNSFCMIILTLTAKRQ